MECTKIFFHSTYKRLIIARIRYQIFFYTTSILFQTRQCSCTSNKTTSWIPRSKDI